jgi:hypothetical protein
LSFFANSLWPLFWSAFFTCCSTFYNFQAFWIAVKLSGTVLLMVVVLSMWLFGLHSAFTSPLSSKSEYCWRRHFAHGSAHAAELFAGWKL